jgi:hypothetical protein
MFYDVGQAVSLCTNDNSLIFKLIKEDEKSVVKRVLQEPHFNYNICDTNGNSLIMWLLKGKYYDELLNILDNPKVDINHQNNDDDTFAHMLVMINYLEVKEIIEKLLKRVEFMPNIKNNKGETILDKSINNNYIYTTAKILSDRRFNNINMVSFKNLYDTYIKSNNYGKYSKIDNLTLIVNNLQRKDLNDSLALLIRLFRRNRKVIYEEITNSDTSRMDFLIDYVVKEMI